MTRIFLLLWAGIGVSTAVNLQKRIIGGQTCTDTTRPYHVRLRGNNGTHNFMCGGSLISDQWILTAAHCRQRTITAFVGVHPGPPDPGQGVIITDPPEIFNDGGRDHDLMLLKLPSPTHFLHISLPDCDRHPNVTDMVEIAGHASTKLGPNNTRQNDVSPTLQCAKIEVIDCQPYLKCLQRGAPQFYQEHGYQHLICARTAGVDISLGDSGGGVVYNNMIYGVISFTGHAKIACATPAAFMDVCHQDYLQWIRRFLPDQRQV